MPDAKPPKRPTAAQKTKVKGVVAPKPAKSQKTGKYTPELAQEIFHRISMGESLLKICGDEGMPTRQAVYNWVSGDESLALQFARAREEGCDALAEEALEIANTPHLGHKKIYTAGEGDESMTVTEEDMLGHRKLQIETRLKLLACWNPKKYGNKVAVGGDPGNPIQVEAQVEADNFLATILKNAELKKQVAANE